VRNKDVKNRYFLKRNEGRVRTKSKMRDDDQ